MPKYRMQAPDGKTYVIDGPAGATDDQVRAAIIAQNPHLADTPQPRPVLSARPAAPKPNAPTVETKPGNWFQRAGNLALQMIPGAGAIASAVQASKSSGADGATFRGIQDEIPGIDHLAAASNEFGTLVGLNKSNLSYADRVKAIKAARENAMQQDVHGPSTGAAVGHYVGEIAGALGTGMGEGRLAMGAVGKIAPKVAPVTNALQRVAPKAVKVATSNFSKMTAAGAAGGATNSAANSTSWKDVPTNAAEGAAVGAVAAPVISTGVKMAAVLARPVVDAFGLSSATGIMRRYVKTSAEDLMARAAAWRARTGADPTLFEILPLSDRQSVQKMLGIVPGETKERAAALIKQRGANIGPEISDKAKKVIHPARQEIIDKMGNDIAASRGETTSTPADMELANRAGRDPAALDEARKTINSNIMAPHDPKPVATLSEITPQEPQLQADGSVKMVDLDSEMTRVIRSAAGTRAASPDPLTVSDTTGMISKLRRVANTSNDFNQASAASRAAQHLEDQLPADAAEAHARMTANNIHYKNKAEGWKAGLASDLRENVNPTGDFQMVRNQFDTPGGQAGRTLGQASALDQQLNTRPGASLGAADDIATNPTTQEAIDRNIGPVAQPDGTVAANAGTQIGDAAAAQTNSARNLAALDAEQPGPSADLPSLAANLIRLESFSVGAKSHAVNNILRSFTKLPQAQATQIVDGLFSQNPAKIDAGLKFLNNAGSEGQKALSALQQSFALGGGIGAAATARDDTGHGATFGDDPVPAPAGEQIVGTIDDNAGGQAPQYGNVTDPAAAAEAPQPSGDQPTGVDPTKSPYMAQLQDIYSKGDPKLLGLANILEGKESKHSHLNPDGTPKISKAGATGLMQVMPGTARGITSQRGIPYDEHALRWDPAYNKLVGVHVLDQLLTHYNGDRVKAAAAYNWHPDALDRTIAEHPNDWKVHLPDETTKYIQGIEP
jgi:hypothetical protein